MFEKLTPGDRDLLRPVKDSSAVEAMLATPTEDRFSDPNWIFERKLDGVRCLAHRDARAVVRLMSRNGQDMSRTYPEVAVAMVDQLDDDAVLDGEIVAFDGRRTSFERLQGRLGIHDPDAALATGIKIFYYVFDVLQVAGQDVRALPLTARKKLLRGSVTFIDPLRYATHRVGAGEDMFRQACERGDEGVVAKRASSRYVTGRSKDWLKFKCVRDQEFVVGGWTEPKGGRQQFGALLIGYWDGHQLRYAGKVGTGFSADLLRSVGNELSRLETRDSPFADRVKEHNAHWCRPELVAQIGFAEWTRDGLLRHPRFKGVRTDKDARDVVRETR